MSEKEKGFYMVYLEGGDNPKFKHLSKLSAETEAKRLAKLTGRKAYILASVYAIEYTEFKTTPTEPELPF